MSRYRSVLKSFDHDAALLMPAGGRSLTIPNQSVNIGEALKRYSAPSIAERLKGYYEDEGMEMPNFDKLDKVERLQLLADTNAKMADAKQRANNAIADVNAKRKTAAEDAAMNNPIRSQSNTQGNEPKIG